MKKFFYILLALVGLYCMTSCASTYKTMREPNVLVELNSGDYTLSEPVQGEGEVVKVLGIDWAHLFNKKTASVNASVFGGLLSSSESYAVYDMLEKNPGYDFVMYPQVTKETKSYVVFSKTLVKVTARLGKFNK